MTVTPLFSTTPAGARLHEAFLDRASQDAGDNRPNALGAFLTLRAIDRIADESDSLTSASLAYQLRACDTYLDEVYPQDEEVTHLREIVRVARKAVASRNPRLIWAPMLAFAFWLEQQLRLDEALDVLETALRLESSALDEKVATHLRRARVQRLAGRFDDATTAYAIAGEIANLQGDWRSEMLSRLGRAELLQHKGDLPAAERELGHVLSAAQLKQDAFIESRAYHDLAVSAHLAKRQSEAVALAFRAFELYEEPAQRLRALNDTGVFLKELGHYSAASEAQLHVLDSAPPPEVRFNAMIELLELAFLVSDRLGFERWSKEMHNEFDRLLPYQQVDFCTAHGTGLAAFGQRAESIQRLERALKLAEGYKLGQRVFEAERLLEETRAGKAFAPPPTVQPEYHPDLSNAISSVYALRAGH